MTHTTHPRQRFASAYEVLQRAIADRAFPGCAFGVLAKGEVALHDALGHFTYESDAPAVTPSTAFDLASLTKVVATTAAVMLLHQRGQLDLEAPLGALLPDWIAGRTASDPARHVTLRNLLAHNSGLPGYVEFFRSAKSSDELRRACLHLNLEVAPGTRATYSDPGFILLGLALESLTSEPLENWLQREIFLPLDLHATTFNPPPNQRPAIPPTEIDTIFRCRTIQGEVQDENAFVLGGIAGHAGLFSTVGDLLRVSSEILSASAGQASARLFTPEALGLFSQPQAPSGSSRTLGWDTPSENSSSGTLFSPHSIGHLGYSGTSLWIDLEAEVAIILLTNRTWPDRKSQLIRTVRPAFHDTVRRVL